MLKCLVLLAEDFEDTRDVYSFYLRREGFEVQDLPDGELILPLAIERQPDVVVLDLSLPGIDGYALAAALRAHPMTAHIPIVVLSAHAYPENEQRARAAGATAFLRKPCLPGDLADTLRRVSENCQRALTSREGGQRTAAL